MAFGKRAHNRKGFSLTGICQVLLLSTAVVMTCNPFTVQASTSKNTQIVNHNTQYFDTMVEDGLDHPEKDSLQAAIENNDRQLLWHNYLISDTDSIETVFLDEGLSQTDLMHLLDLPEGIEYLTDLSQAKNLRYKLNADNRLTALEITLNTDERLRFERNLENGNANFCMSVMQAAVSLEITRIQGDIQGSFYKSGKEAGLSASTIQQYANIFQWDIDFNRDLRAGDRFELLVKTSDGGEQIIGARLYQKNKTLSALLYSDGQYYSEEGHLLGSSFDRFPLGKNYRVSSHFNLARKHPIKGVVRPHKGTDWAVPVGTPVMATAEGVVVKAVKNHPSAGNYIEIRNGRRYVTRFLHLDKLNVKRGDKVKRGDVIALSGNTGLSTGPHLHYELYVDGRVVNPMKARLPEGKALQGAELTEFQAMTSHLVGLMNQNDNPVLLASKIATPDVKGS